MTVAVFAGSSAGKDEAFTKAAVSLGSAMAERGLSLVYGGGYRGLMGILAESVREGGGYVIGILPEAMDNDRVRLKPVESELRVVPDMHERKSLMYSLSDAFIAIPGGIGTLEELSEIFTWKQLGKHDKNIGLLDVNGFWDPLLHMLDLMRDQGFLSPAVRDALIIEEDAGRLLDRISAEEHPLPSKI